MGRFGAEDEMNDELGGKNDDDEESLTATRTISDRWVDKVMGVSGKKSTSEL